VKVLGFVQVGVFVLECSYWVFKLGCSNWGVQVCAFKLGCSGRCGL
jgi:hypothetical protein